MINSLLKTFSSEFCSPHSQHGWPEISSTTCNANIIMFLAFTGILFLQILMTLFNKIFKKNIPFGLAEIYSRSIFSALSLDTRTKKTSWWFLSFIVSHGILFIRPLGYILATIVMQKTSWYPLAIFTTTVADTIFFFDVLFVIFFFGMKIEMLHIGGNPAVSLEERKWFLKTVLKRSSAFAFLYFCSGMLRMSTNRDSFTLFDQRDSPLFDWALGMIQYVLLFTLAFARRSYVNYSKIMLEQKIKQNKIKYLNLSFTQHINTKVLPSESVPEVLRNIEGSDEKKFLQEFTNQISRQVHVSSYVFKDTRTLNDNYQNSFPLIENTREKYIVGTISLVCIIIDSLFNALTALTGMVVKMLKDKNAVETDQSPIHTITFILMILYICETVILFICAFVVVSDKTNFGGSAADQRESNGNRPSNQSNQSLTDNLLENQEVSLIAMKRPELLHSTAVPQSFNQTNLSGACKEDFEIKTQERGDSSICIHDI